MNQGNIIFCCEINHDKQLNSNLWTVWGCETRPRPQGSLTVHNVGNEGVDHCRRGFIHRRWTFGNSIVQSLISNKLTLYYLHDLTSVKVQYISYRNIKIHSYFAVISVIYHGIYRGEASDIKVCYKRSPEVYRIRCSKGKTALGGGVPP